MSFEIKVLFALLALSVLSRVVQMPEDVIKGYAGHIVGSVTQAANGVIQRKEKRLTRNS